MSRFPTDPPEPEWWVPNTDVYVSEEGHLVIEIELAAIKKEDLELTVDANRITIRGERPDSARQQRRHYLVKEMRHGPFESAIEIPPDFDPAHAMSDCRNGILQIDVPRKRERN